MRARTSSASAVSFGRHSTTPVEYVTGPSAPKLLLAVSSRIRRRKWRAPVAVVSGSARAEIEPVLEAAGIAKAITLLVSEDDITRSKPDPEGYLIALDLLGVDPSGAVAVEDSEAGVAAAKAAGIYCVAVTTTLPPARLSAADELAERIDRALIARLVSPQ